MPNKIIDDPVEIGPRIGSGRRSGFVDAYAKVQERKRIDGSNLGDAPNELLRAGARIVETRKADTKDVVYDVPMRMSIAKAQSPDLSSETFDVTSQGAVVIGAGANVDILTITVPNAVRGVLKRFGWYTTGAGAAALTFGLYVNNQLVAPGGKHFPVSPLTLNQYSPSGGSINDFEKLAECNFHIEPDSTAVIRVTNPGLIAYNAWGRVWGWAWEEETRESGDAAWYNRKLQRIT